MRITETTKVKKQMNIPVNDENQWLKDADLGAERNGGGFYLITFFYYAIFRTYFRSCVSPYLCTSFLLFFFF